MTPFSWNADRELILPGQHRSQIGVGWRNYLDTEWKVINTNVQPDKTITAFPGNVSFPSSSQGWSNIVLDHKFSIKRTIDVGNNNNYEPELSMDLQVLTQHNVTGNIDGSWMVYPNAWDTADLMLGVELGRAARIKKIVKINSMPSGSGDVEYQFNLRSSDAKVFAGPNFDIRPWAGSVGDLANVTSPVFIAKGDSVLRGALLKTPKCWWFDNGEKVEHDITVSFVIQSDGETVLGTKYIPRTYITQALAAGSSLYTDATFSPDADPETNSADGRARRNGTESWSAKRDGVGLYFSDSSSAEKVHISMHSTTNNYDIMDRLFAWIDTSSIGSGQAVDSGDWAFTTSNINTGDIGMEVNLCGSTSSNVTSVAAADYQTASFSPLYSDTSITATSAGTFTRNSLTLNQDGRDAVNVTGLTRFCLGCSNYDFADIEPTWVSSGDQQLGVYMSEQGVAGRDPELTVTHSAAGPAIPILISHYDNMRAR